MIVTKLNDNNASKSYDTSVIKDIRQEKGTGETLGNVKVNKESMILSIKHLKKKSNQFHTINKFRFYYSIVAYCRSADNGINFVDPKGFEVSYIQFNL